MVKQEKTEVHVLEEKEFNNIFAIPVNYTDSGKVLGGMFELRNVIEAIILLLIIGYPELRLIPMSGTVRIIVMAVTLIPIVIITLVGIDGESLFQYAGHIFKFFLNKRELHYRRIGGKNVQTKKKKR
jgi:hypothetical protein